MTIIYWIMAVIGLVCYTYGVLQFAKHNQAKVKAGLEAANELLAKGKAEAEAKIAELKAKITS